MPSDHDSHRSAPDVFGSPRWNAIRLFVSTGSAIASFWSEERSQKAFGAGDYRPGWYLLDDDSVELDGPTGWEPLIHEIDRACFEDETVAAVRQRGHALLHGSGKAWTTPQDTPVRAVQSGGCQSHQGSDAR
jgi:hypothetical protein